MPNPNELSVLKQLSLDKVLGLYVRSDKVEIAKSQLQNWGYKKIDVMALK